jgi:hypothetical protein
MPVGDAEVVVEAEGVGVTGAAVGDLVSAGVWSVGLEKPTALGGFEVGTYIATWP